MPPPLSDEGFQPESTKRQRNPPGFYNNKNFDALEDGSEQRPLEIDDDDSKSRQSKKPRIHQDDQEYGSLTDTKASAPKARKGPKPKYLSWNKDELQVEYKKLKDELDEIKDKKTTIKKARTGDRRQWAEEKERRKNAQSENAKFKQENQDLLNKSKQQALEYEKIIAENRSTFNEAQKDLFAKIKTQSFPTFTDDAVRGKLSEIMTRCKDWVKEWRSQDPDTEWPPALLAFLSGLLRGCEDVVKEQLLDHIPSMGAKGRRLVAHSSLMRAVLLTFFNDPFQLLQILDLDDQICKNLKKTYKEFLNDDKSKALSWRAETIRTLRHSVIQDLKTQTVHRDASTRLGNYCSNVTTDLLQTNLPTGLLTELTTDESMKRQNELYEILFDTTVLALDLWSQKADIKLVKCRILREGGFLIESDLYEPHPHMCLDDEDHSFDGMRIQAVLAYGLQAFGNPDGENLEHPRTWLKAVVLLLKELATNFADRLVMPYKTPSSPQARVDQAHAEQAKSTESRNMETGDSSAKLPESKLENIEFEQTVFENLDKDNVDKEPESGKEDEKEKGQEAKQSKGGEAEEAGEDQTVIDLDDTVIVISERPVSKVATDMGLSMKIPERYEDA